MSAFTVDEKQGMARDYMEVWQGEVEKPEYEVVDLTLSDDDTLNITWGMEPNTFSLWIPLDRLRKLLASEIEPPKQKHSNGKWTNGRKNKISKAMKAAWAKRKEKHAA
jgi:hypothetical protein